MPGSKSQRDRLFDAAALSKKSEVEKAEHLIWFAMRAQKRPAAYLPHVAGLFAEAHLAKPNVARLRSNLKSKRIVVSREAENGSDQFSLPRDKLQELDRTLGRLVFDTPEERLLDDATEALKQLISRSTSFGLRTFLFEAVGCLESGYLRAAVVLSWSGAIERICDFLFDHKLTEFN